MSAKTADRRPTASRLTIEKEHLGRFNRDENKYLNCISLVMKCGFIILNLKQQFHYENKPIEIY